MANSDPTGTGDNTLHLYRYKALKKSGRTVHGVLSARSEQHLFSQLSESKLELLKCNIIKPKKALIAGFTGIGIRDKIQLFTQLEQMQRAGIPFLRVLENCKESFVDSPLRDTISDLHRMVSEGMNMSEAVGQFPKIFTQFERSIISSMEEIGDMPRAYRYIIDHLIWADSMRSRIKKSTRYPVILFVVIVAVVLIMMTHVVPQILGFITTIEEGKDLPFLTTALVATSDFFQAYWWAVILGIIMSLAVFLLLRMVSADFRYKSDDFFLRLPKVGELIRKIEIARFAHITGVLFAANVPLLECIRSAEDVVSNRVIKASIQDIEQSLREGVSFHQSLKRTQEFPSMVIQMVEVGEETGNMTHVLEQVNDFYMKDVDESIQGMIALIEPGLTVLLGIIMLWIAVAIFGPIYSMFETMF